MTNINGKAYAMNAITPIKPWKTPILRLIFFILDVWKAKQQDLKNLSFIHFARWVIIRRDQWPDLGQGKQVLSYDYMLFCSNFNGTWDQYIDAFSDGIPDGLDLFWYSSVKYPHSIPINPFKSYITYNQIDTDYYYNATPGAAQRDIKSALTILGEIRGLAVRYSALTPQNFTKEYLKSLLKLQNCLGSQGAAPTASLDTEMAERIRLHLGPPNPAGT